MIFPSFHEDTCFLVEKELMDENFCTWSYLSYSENTSIVGPFGGAVGPEFCVKHDIGVHSTDGLSCFRDRI